MSSLESWKRNLESAKDQLRVLKMQRSDILKGLSNTIAAQTNKETKARYRQQKADKKKDWDQRIEQQKKYIDSLKNQKPKK
jgi:hypothetical protein